ncbi:NADPH-dependent fmn reductase [Plakobranchus ocellatus]|uniref:NADPH-dependent fmn reductase n=1 Tax=Plakobranchus ocellatus TaxID=259542 RepID=A0AAV3Z244_9GAST|nr:NADPH-dependent fmn reductase [Plakobranchus ocellatus]
MTFAVSNVGGLIYHELTEGGMTGQRFNEFIGTVCRLYHPLNACFVIDNAPAHRQAVNLPLPQDFSVRYLPPYSPFLNICESAFALWKGNIKDSVAEVRDQLLREDHQQRMATLGQLAEKGTAVVTLHRMQAALGRQAYLPACFGLDDILIPSGAQIPPSRKSHTLWTDYIYKNQSFPSFSDPVELKFPLLEKAIHHYSDRSAIPDWMLQCEAKVKAADAFLVVSAEYNHSIPPALSNMMDHFGGSLFAYKPSGIVVYSPGIYGGMRAAMQLRAFLSELGTLSVSNIFGIPEVHKALDEGGAPLNDHMEKGANTLLNQLDWMTLAMKNHRDKHGVPK